MAELSASGVIRAPKNVLDRMRRDVERNALRARNGIKLASGTGMPRLGQTPKDLVWESGDRCRLWRYRSDRVTTSPPLLIVFSLMSRPYVIDLQPGNSFVELLQAAGFDVFLVDWVPADERHADETLETYVDEYLPEAVRQTCRSAGSSSVNLFGYCFGGILTALYAAHHHRSAPLRSLTCMAAPIDFSQMDLLAELGKEGRIDVDRLVDDTGNVPASAIRHVFRLMRPTADVRTYVDLLENVWNDEYVTSHYAMTTWGNDHVPFPGATAKQTVDMLLRDNAFMTDRVYLGGDHVRLKDITVPMLTIIAERDYIVQQPVAAPLPDLVGSEDNETLLLPAGHMGLIVGRTAMRVTGPLIIEFLQARSETIGAAS